MGTMYLPIWYNRFHEFPESGRMVFMYGVSEFVHDNIVDDFPRCHEESPWEVQVITTTARSPASGGTGDADLFVLESMFL